MFANVSVKVRLIGAVIIGFFLLGGVITGLSVKKSYDSAVAMKLNQLDSVRVSKQEHLEDYFKDTASLLLSNASSTQTISAMKDFSGSFYNVAAQSGYSFEMEKSKVLDHYDKLYLDKVNYGVPNAEKRKSTEDYLPESLNGKAAQQIFIIDNPEPIGEKNNKIDVGRPKVDYAVFHKKYHNSFNTILKEFALYDIFLINTSGDLVYTVFKEKDYATNLFKGIYAETGLGDAYQQAMKLKKGEVYINDFKPYEPSYNLPASFISTPVYDGDEKIGVLIFQMSIDKIDAIMSFNGKYEDAGLGSTGRSMIVGSDGTMRNNDRFLKEIGNELVKNLGTTIGVLNVDDPAVEKALAGQSGAIICTTQSGEKKLTSFSELNLLGLKWAIVLNMSKSEALSGAVKLRNTLIIISMIITIVLTLLMTLLMNRAVISKLNNVITLMENLVSGDADLTKRLELTKSKEMSKDEIVRLTQYVDAFILTVHDIITEIKMKSSAIDSGSSEVSAITQEISLAFHDQSGRINDIATAMEEMSVTSDTVLGNVSETLAKTANATGKTNDGIKALGMAVGGIENISSKVGQLSEIIKGLNNSSTQIGDILNVINDIADQTNLLALNAAIEAARAGEAGRGFAVVADEVRKLAERTQVATTEISTIVNSLQSESSNASKEMLNAEKSVEEGVEVINSANNIFTEIVSSVEDINVASNSIETAVKEQNFAIESVSESVNSIAMTVQQNNESVAQVSDRLSELSVLVSDMDSTVNRFKTK